MAKTSALVSRSRNLRIRSLLTLADRDVAERSILIKNMVGDLGEEAMDEAIPIPNVNAAVLKKVIEWCQHHKHDPPSSNEDDSDSRKKTTDIEEWDQKFMQVDQEMLFEIILVCLRDSNHARLLLTAP